MNTGDYSLRDVGRREFQAPALDLNESLLYDLLWYLDRRGVYFCERDTYGGTFSQEYTPMRREILHMKVLEWLDGYKKEHSYG